MVDRPIKETGFSLPQVSERGKEPKLIARRRARDHTQRVIPSGYSVAELLEYSSPGDFWGDDRKDRDRGPVKEEKITLRALGTDAREPPEEE